MSAGHEDTPAGPDQRSDRSFGVLDDAYQQLRTFRRVRQGRVVAGVCTGVGHRLGIDPVVVRIGLAVLALMSGVGALLYVAAWVLFPDQDSDESIADRLFGRAGPGDRRGAVIVGIVGILALAGAGMMPIGDGPWGPILLILIVVGVIALLRRQSGGETTTQQPTTTIDPGAAGGPAPTPSSDAPSEIDLAGEAPGSGAPQSEPAAPRTWTQHAATSPPPGFWDQPDPLGLEVDDEPTIEPAPPPPPAPRRRPRSKLVPATAMVALLTLGLMILLDNAAGISIPLGAYFAVALGITGLGLVLGTWFGRPRGLIAVGIVLSLALVPASVAGGIGSWDGLTTTNGGYAYHPSPTSIDQMQSEYTHSFGEMVIDLTEVDFADADEVELSASLDIGELVIILPSEVDVTLQSSGGIGSVNALGREQDGPYRELEITDLGSDGRGGGQLTVTADVGIGDLEVRRG